MTFEEYAKEHLPEHIWLDGEKLYLVTSAINEQEETCFSVGYFPEKRWRSRYEGEYRWFERRYKNEAVDEMVKCVMTGLKEGRLSTPYDSASDTRLHIARVAQLMSLAQSNLAERARLHDLSKLSPEEKPYFDRLTPRLKHLEYGSAEYKQSLAELQPALDHHYAHNPHHPEHYLEGVRGMSLLDLVEMLCDWKAAGERHADSTIWKSIQVNRDRFGMSDEMTGMLFRTAMELFPETDVDTDEWLALVDEFPTPLAGKPERSLDESRQENRPFCAEDVANKTVAYSTDGREWQALSWDGEDNVLPIFFARTDSYEKAWCSVEGVSHCGIHTLTREDPTTK